MRSRSDFVSVAAGFAGSPHRVRRAILACGCDTAARHDAACICMGKETMFVPAHVSPERCQRHRTYWPHCRVRVDPRPRQVAASGKGEDEDAILILPAGDARYTYDSCHNLVHRALTHGWARQLARQQQRCNAQKAICGSWLHSNLYKIRAQWLVALPLNTATRGTMAERQPLLALDCWPRYPPPAVD